VNENPEPFFSMLAIQLPVSFFSLLALVSMNLFFFPLLHERERIRPTFLNRDVADFLSIRRARNTIYRGDFLADLEKVDSPFGESLSSFLQNDRGGERGTDFFRLRARPFLASRKPKSVFFFSFKKEF
jgi:hypothetical protein